MRPGELAHALQLNAYQLGPLVKALAKQKAIVVTGKTNQRRLSLPGAVPKEAP